VDVAVTVTVDPSAYAGQRSSPTAELAARGFRELSSATESGLETHRGIADERVLGLFVAVPGVIMIARGGPADRPSLQRDRESRLADRLGALHGATFERGPFETSERMEGRRRVRCAACRAVFVDPRASARDERRAAEHPEYLVEGYVTETDDGLEWVCPRCFGELRVALAWAV
jgi:hypothetical protein